MSAAATEWEPGDPNPYVRDDGCGSIPVVNWTDHERRAAMREDTFPPQWFRPAPTSLPEGMVRHCPGCGVQWRGDDPCWMCGQENTA